MKRAGLFLVLLLLFVVELVQAEPVLFRRVTYEDARLGTDHILTAMPADAYCYGHGSYADNVTATGKQVYWYCNAFHIDERYAPGGPWVGYFHCDWFAYADEHNLWLRDDRGTLVRFRWFSQDPMLNFSKVTDEHASAFADMVDVPGPYFIDQQWPRVYDWMLYGDVTVRDLAEYSDLAYLHGVQRFQAALRALPGGSASFVNGWYNWDTNGTIVMYENADQGSNAADLGWTVARWRTTPGSILELERGLDHPETLRVIQLWLRSDSILGLVDPQAAAVAWAMKQ